MSEKFELFKYSDFRNEYGYLPTPQEVADIANAKLQQWLAAQPVVYSREFSGETVWCTETLSMKKGDLRGYNCRARLCAIVPLVKESEERRLLREALRDYDTDQVRPDVYIQIRRLLEGGERDACKV